MPVIRIPKGEGNENGTEEILVLQNHKRHQNTNIRYSENTKQDKFCFLLFCFLRYLTHCGQIEEKIENLESGHRKMAYSIQEL